MGSCNVSTCTGLTYNIVEASPHVYDNASAMSGRCNGLQAKVAAKNNLAAWIPCAGHSLNLVGKAAAECCTAAVSFCDIMECVEVYMYSSQHLHIVTKSCAINLNQPIDLSACPKGSTLHGGRAGQMRVRHLFRDILK